MSNGLGHCRGKVSCIVSIQTIEEAIRPGEEEEPSHALTGEKVSKYLAPIILTSLITEYASMDHTFYNTFFN